MFIGKSKNDLYLVEVFDETEGRIKRISARSQSSAARRATE